MSATARKIIVAEARSWIGRKFHHLGRVRDVGCDCLGLIMGVAKDLKLPSKNYGYFSEYDPLVYSKLPDVLQIRALLTTHLEQIESDFLQPADILLLKCAERPQHMAIVSDYGESLGIIHACAKTGRVVEHLLDQYWQRNVVNGFTFKYLAQ